MDPALKKRLVGATVLTALAVIFIPMLFDGPRSQRQVSVEIPSPPDARMETRLMPVEPPQSGVDDPVSVPRSPPATQRASRERASTRPVPEETPASSGEAPTDSGPAVTAESTATTIAPPDGEWVLQLGSFSNATNATRLVERIQAAGWNAFQEAVTVADKTTYRVRAGYWRSKDEAAEVGTRLTAGEPDLEVSVRRLSVSEPDEDVAPGLASGWMVQVGSFSEQSNALALRDRLRGKGFAAHVETIDSNYRVRVGPELDRAGATATLERLRSTLALNGIIVSHP